MSAEETLRSTLVALSDTKLLLGYHYGEWTFGPPAIEAGIAACSMAQEEFGHTRLLNGILKREFDLEIDPLADVRPPEAIASIAFLDRPLGSWTGLVAANAVVDLALSLALSSFEGGSFQPLARVVPKMLLEERFHAEHAEGWVRLIESRGGEARGALRRALSGALAAVTAFFGPPGHDADLVGSGVRTSDDEALCRRLCSRIASLVGDASEVGLVPDGDGWSPAEPADWSGWDPARRRLDSGGPDGAILDELRGTKNVAFKSA
ncbi:MAG TPA: Phenylacetic acid catabolic protein [Gemmatimonadota bacterium]|nr:Phenylacetic acid catabolic protein [Gemmatimonadota bacterium]